MSLNCGIRTHENNNGALESNSLGNGEQERLQSRGMIHSDVCFKVTLVLL